MGFTKLNTNQQTQLKMCDNMIRSLNNPPEYSFLFYNCANWVNDMCDGRLWPSSADMTVTMVSNFLGCYSAPELLGCGPSADLYCTSTISPTSSTSFTSAQCPALPMPSQDMVRDRPSNEPPSFDLQQMAAQAAQLSTDSP
jgi:hypothetical protein